MDDPKSASDCLKHCREVLVDREWRLAVFLIEVYARTRAIDAIDEVRAAYDEAFAKAFDAPVTAAEAAKAEDAPT